MKWMLTATAALVTIGAAFAFEIIFSSAATSVNGQNLVVSFTATTTKPVPSNRATFVVTADATATWVCVNRGAKVPKSPNKREVVKESVRGEGTFTWKGKNISGKISVPAPDGANLKCPPGQTKMLQSVVFTNVLLESDALGVSKRLADARKAQISLRAK